MNLLYPLAKRFIAGHSFDSAKPVIEKLMNDGYEVSIDYIGENSKTITQVRKACLQYIKIIRYFKNRTIDISVKPSQLGLTINPYLSFIFCGKLAKYAARHGHTIRLDMESSEVTELTRNLAISLNRRHGNVGVAIQANLYRTDEDLKILTELGVSVRLVKGAYKESEKIAYQKPFEIEQSFFHYAANLYSNKANKPAVGTHDEELLEDMEELIPNADYFDYEFLYGIRRDLQKSLKEKGYCVRIYIPFGTEWLPYTLRRLGEWKNLKFVIKNIFREWFF